MPGHHDYRKLEIEVQSVSEKKMTSEDRWIGQINKWTDSDDSNATTSGFHGADGEMRTFTRSTRRTVTTTRRSPWRRRARATTLGRLVPLCLFGISMLKLGHTLICKEIS